MFIIFSTFQEGEHLNFIHLWNSKRRIALYMAQNSVMLHVKEYNYQTFYIYEKSTSLMINHSCCSMRMLHANLLEKAFPLKLHILQKLLFGVPVELINKHNWLLVLLITSVEDMFQGRNKENNDQFISIILFLIVSL